MKIEQIIKLWNKSKYDYLILKTLPCINHLGELTYGTAIHKKGSTILYGSELKIEDYLIKAYKDSIFIIEDLGENEDSIKFKMIIKGDSSEKEN